MKSDDVANYGAGFEYIRDAQVGQSERFVEASFEVDPHRSQLLVDALR